MVPVKVKLGDAILNLNLPAWLALRLKLSNTVAKTGETKSFPKFRQNFRNFLIIFQFLMISYKQFFNILKFWSRTRVQHKASSLKEMAWANVQLLLDAIPIHSFIHAVSRNHTRFEFPFFRLVFTLNFFFQGAMQSTRISLVLEHRRKRMCHLSIWGLC